MARNHQKPAQVDISVRRMDFAFTDIPRYWALNDPVCTHFLNALSLTFPDGERFFVDSVRALRDRVEDKVRQKEISGFIGQVLLLRAAPAGGTAWLWAVVLTAGLVALVALSRAGSALFWKTEGLRAEGGGARPLAFAPVVVLLGAAVVLTVCAGPVTRYTEATAAQLLAPAGYTGAVLTREDRP